MKRPFHQYLGALLFAGCLIGAVASASAQTRPANTLVELFADLRTCFGAARGNNGSELAIVFSLRRNGSLIGRPRISYARLPEDPAERQRFLASTAAALAKCLPVSITDGLGGAIAGRPLTLRIFIGRQAAMEPSLWLDDRIGRSASL